MTRPLNLSKIEWKLKRVKTMDKEYLEGSWSKGPSGVE